MSNLVKLPSYKYFNKMFNDRPPQDDIDDEEDDEDEDDEF